MSDYVSYEGVELLSVGMKWSAKGGELTFTFEHLADAVEAANEDPHIRVPRLKLGHVDDRFQTDEGDHDPFYELGEGEPAFGQIANLRLENDGATLVGDFINVPGWLAEAMPSAYPSRSIEGAYIDGSWDVTTPGGKHYSFVLTDCALLGIRLPAIMDLEDLQAALKGEGAEVVEGQGAPAASIGDMAKPALSADADKVVKRFWDEIATDDRYWWWPRAIWTESGFVIADDDEGSLWRVDYTSSEDGEVSFADPVEVRESFVDVTNGEPAAAVAADKLDEDRPARVFASAAAARETAAPKRAPSPVSGQPPLASTVDGVKEIAKKLGLDEDASEADVLAKIDTLTGDEPGQSDPPEGDPPSDSPPDSDPPEEAEPEAEADVTTVKVDRKGLEKLQADAAAGRQALESQQRAHREAVLQAALDDGKIATASKEAWAKKLERAPEATEAELAELPTGMVPTAEKGGDAAPEASDEAELAAIRSSYGIKPAERSAA